ncbi:MAG: tetratricopeptide repeat protein [Rhodospirillales bacterium]|nr:tetratricopeptide repeat protein [Rhodospirillales bacterium]
MAAASSALAIALKHHQAGQLADAERLYRQVLARQPREPNAWHLLGVIALQSNHPDAAIEPIRKAIAIHPKFPEAYYNLGNAFDACNRLDEAATAFAKAVRLKPDYAEAHHNFGRTRLREGKHAEAIIALRRAIALQPQLAAAHSNLGVALMQQGDLANAAESFERALALAPGMVDTRTHLGSLRLSQGRHEDAATAFRQATEHAPDYAKAHHGLGIALSERGDAGGAIAALIRTTELDPACVPAYGNLGNVLVEIGEPARALIVYRRALELDPQNFVVLVGAAQAHSALDQYEPARGYIEQAIAAYPDSPEPHNTLGNIRMKEGRLADSAAAFERALALRPGWDIGWRNLRLCTLYRADLDEVGRQAVARRFEDEAARPHYPASPQWAVTPDPHRRLRIGYLSSDFRGQSVGRVIMPILEAHDRGRFEVFCYAHVRRPDPFTERCHQAADSWRSTVGFGDDDVADMIRADGIDLLVCLASHFDENRFLVCARRPAPVQISYQDVATGGLAAVDYIFADPVLAPRGSGEYFAERPFRLPHYIVQSPILGAPPVGPLPALTDGTIAFGSASNPSKIGPDVVAAWADVLHTVPNSILRLKFFNAFADDSLCARFRESFAAHGVDAARLHFEGGSATTIHHLSFYDRVDIMLDTFPFTGSTTSFEALWMGVPVVTMAGDAMLSRYGAAALASIGRPGWAAANRAGFVDIARRLAGDIPGLAAERASLRDRVAGSPLCDVPRRTRQIERAYRAMWRRWCATRPAAGV